MFNAQRPVKRAFLLIGIIGCVLSCAALAFAAIFLRPRSFATFADAIGYVLDRRGVAYERILIERAWPDTVNDIAYGANLLIVTPDKGTVVGRLDCRGWKTDCFFTVRAFGVYREPLPELTEQRRLPWVAWIEQTLGIRFGLTLHLHRSRDASAVLSSWFPNACAFPDPFSF